MSEIFDNGLAAFLIGLAVLILVVLITREINCWYWKINERIDLLKEQNLVLKQILNELQDKSASKLE